MTCDPICDVGTSLSIVNEMASAITGTTTKLLFRFPHGDCTWLDIEVVNDFGYIPIRLTELSPRTPLARACFSDGVRTVRNAVPVVARPGARYGFEGSREAACRAVPANRVSTVARQLH